MDQQRLFDRCHNPKQAKLNLEHGLAKRSRSHSSYLHRSNFFTFSSLSAIKLHILIGESPVQLWRWAEFIAELECLPLPQGGRATVKLREELRLGFGSGIGHDREIADAYSRHGNCSKIAGDGFWISVPTQTEGSAGGPSWATSLASPIGPIKLGFRCP